MYKWQPADINNPFKCRKGEIIVDLEKYKENLDTYGYQYTQEQYQEAKDLIEKQKSQD